MSSHASSDELVIVGTNSDDAVEIQEYSGKRAKNTSGANKRRKTTKRASKKLITIDESTEAKVDAVHPETQQIDYVNKPAPTQNEDGSKYRIIFRNGPHTKEWMLDADDSTEVLYDDLFGKGSTRVICLEGVLVSRYLTISENGFFSGTNYITLSEDDKESIKTAPEITVQMDDSPKNNIVIPFNPEMRVSDVISKIVEMRGVKDPQMIYNGLILRPEMILNSFINDGDVVDAVESTLLSQM